MNWEKLKKNYRFSYLITSKSEADLDVIFQKIIEKQIQFIYLIGDYGSGKTDFAKKFARKIGIKEKIISPSFNFMFVYENLVHIDLDNFPGQIDEFYDYFDNNFVIIEWADKLTKFSKNSVLITFKILDLETRSVKIYWN
ncbi:tRNA (adenosine(37)-N6)-threonylcarbamoyltransferase complex ATPase subunit type 1 TsaE [Mycoplasma flocculare]|uniref:tRNA (Adenosine(37)-N6)-threonylcarbamoyltransferase complex ATPase subunit type 1 TsaE n=1 Tax=Mesomycoplasma flocculare TaxID=2128 RepID=A0AAW9XC86_MESFC|nr:tRNA (adenosine(37)-N6)-threonylcarbamoyltransferase complex ATPase subunit type 1 TsaE [Mesomycoplasma flocculare]MXR06158.1 tRNA (adenosine(37)-N6)-threonylcarbamoyltransferase complex ATPase subunit type 1 TsaE [Mesomycoplasma flocculare]MXR39707.1 tRNA (adenosine(37)-N6)-threonylcarbamoyltransferase complex ATPase subunit type 1 TsaE [Mycoplasma sp. MF12]MXR56942.1 tRNA (adenosine(37)-N6)-threonylcarbamoyltransferase complex ATPase subunit type 1 TsaE [Mesomycoplasma flocculare]